VHVVDKATKLQTIFDRINLVDTRFEVIKRDTEIAALKARLEAVEKGDRAAASKVEHDASARLRQIEDDREFLRYCNVGGEAMKPDDQERVRQISAKYRWIDVQGRNMDFLNEDEIENLTITGRHSNGSRAPDHQPPYRGDDSDAGGAAVAAPLEERAGICRRPP
jgi:hypothetical protein